MRKNKKIEDRTIAALAAINGDLKKGATPTAKRVADKLEVSKNYALVLFRELEKTGRLVREKDGLGRSIPGRFKVILKKKA